MSKLRCGLRCDILSSLLANTLRVFFYLAQQSKKLHQRSIKSTWWLVIKGIEPSQLSFHNRLIRKRSDRVTIFVYYVSIQHLSASLIIAMILKIVFLTLFICYTNACVSEKRFNFFDFDILLISNIRISINYHVEVCFIRNTVSISWPPLWDEI